MPKYDVSYATQIKMFATTQLVERWMDMQSTGNLTIKPPTPSYSPMSPTYAVRGFDHNDGPYGPQCITSPPARKRWTRKNN
ncbi:Hypothetical protein CINCED_3A017694 [Cinara cedri]|uniref:Uncharacterized protein n=1 Tax=Cinara cedri TaxID=506608 RepID=A0A5E4N849_9HEMI|nr:Hypothetical protein CINCED_3A017694 [Cinara cedri]